MLLVWPLCFSLAGAVLFGKCFGRNCSVENRLLCLWEAHNHAKQHSLSLGWVMPPTVPAPTTTIIAGLTWKWPVTGIVKLNFDAFFKPDADAGLGMVVRDEDGMVLATTTTFPVMVSSSVLAEALALRWSMLLAIDLVSGLFVLKLIASTCSTYIKGKEEIRRVLRGCFRQTLSSPTSEESATASPDPSQQPPQDPLSLEQPLSETSDDPPQQPPPLDPLQSEQSLSESPGPSQQPTSQALNENAGSSQQPPAESSQLERSPPESRRPEHQETESHSPEQQRRQSPPLRLRASTSHLLQGSSSTPGPLTVSLPPGRRASAFRPLQGSSSTSGPSSESPRRGRAASSSGKPQQKPPPGQGPRQPQQEQQQWPVRRVPPRDPPPPAGGYCPEQASSGRWGYRRTTLPRTQIEKSTYVIILCTWFTLDMALKLKKCATTDVKLK
ncbi:uncharacterized protein LOC130737056 [Lotus japonicus]|uniref:uncharacterized protein LOC130737056 n=1 Tax=Lotus japonicus TaxID=34305 RepID=UPI0025873895|nr:uncharacterized protein LOC130737056 [Lotus japonicus]